MSLFLKRTRGGPRESGSRPARHGRRGGRPAPHGRHGDRPLQGGFTLVEAAVALLLIGLVLVFSLVTLFAYPRYTRRLASRTEAYRTAEAVLETVRSGQIPVVPGEYTLPRVFAPLDGREEMRVRLLVEAAGTPDLYRVEVEVTTSRQGESREVVLESLTWSPGR